MHISPINVCVLALLAYAITRLPDQYRPDWTRRLDAWQTLLAAVAFVAALLIIMNPEMYALGLLGDSAFFDLLVLGLTLQLNTMGLRLWSRVAPGWVFVKRFLTRWLYQNYYAILSIGWLLMWTYANLASMMHKITHRILL